MPGAEMSVHRPTDGAGKDGEASRGGMHRRAVVTLAVLAMQQLLSLGPSIVPASECAAADAARAPPRAGAALPYMLNACSPGARTLLQTIPVMPFGAPATDATIEVALAQDIERQAVALERGSQSLATSTLLPGSWRLLYSNAREIRNLAGGLPLGFVLGRVYQPLDPAGGRFENQVYHLFFCLVVWTIPPRLMRNSLGLGLCPWRCTASQ